MLADSCASGMFPSNDSVTWHSLPSPGSSRVEFPWLDGTMKCSDLLRPSHHTRLPSRGATRCCVCGFAPVGPERRPQARGSSSGPLCRTWTPGDASGFPRFLENPCVPLPCSSTPAGPRASGHHDALARPPLCPQRRLPQECTFRGSIARLRNWLFTLRRGRCRTRRKTRFRSLAKLSRAGLVTRRVPLKGFRVASYISFPLPKLCLAQGQGTLPLVKSGKVPVPFSRRMICTDAQRPMAVTDSEPRRNMARTTFSL
jgi:hypothetical protein